MTDWQLMLLSTVGWVLANAGGKWLTNQQSTPLVNNLVMFQLGIPLFIMSLVVVGVPHAPWQTWLVFALQVTLIVIANYAFMHAFDYGGISLVVPFASMTPIFAVVTSQLLLGEIPSFYSLISIILVSVAGFILYHPSQGAQYRQAIGWALTAAILWSLTAPLDKVLFPHFIVWQYTVMLMAVTAMIFGTAALTWNRAVLVDIYHRHPWQILGISLMATAAQILQLQATRVLLVATVNAIKRGGMLLGSIVFGKLLFQERFDQRKQLALGVLAIGLIFFVLESIYA